MRMRHDTRVTLLSITRTPLIIVWSEEFTQNGITDIDGGTNPGRVC